MGGLPPYTLFHVLVSLGGIVSGAVVVLGLLAAERREVWTALFLATTVTTSVTGFGFPFTGVLPSHAIGVLSLVVLTLAIVGRYRRHLAGAWRWIYAAGAVMALYFNVFVLVVQLFRKVPALKALAPTQSELPFVATQLAVLLVFLVLGYGAVRRFHPRTGAVI